VASAELENLLETFERADSSSGGFSEAEGSMANKIEWICEVGVGRVRRRGFIAGRQLGVLWKGALIQISILFL
jgi:hypothetical protein